MGNTISFKKEFGLIVVGAIVFTASFLWKDLLSDIEEIYFPKHHGIMGRAMYTLLITVVLILLAIHLRGIFGISTNSKSPIQFDDQPIDDNDDISNIGNLNYESLANGNHDIG